MSSYYDGVNHRILALVPQEATTILDIGCANGRLGEAIKAQMPGREVWGIESVPSVAEEAKSRLDRVLAGDIERMNPLPLPLAYFDCITCGDVLEHLREPGQLLSKLRAHLKPGGSLLVCVPNVGHWSVVLELLQGSFRYADSGLLDRTHLRFFTLSSLESMLWNNGYIVETQDPHFLDNPALTGPMLEAALKLGIDEGAARQSLATYQNVLGLRLRPDASDEERRKILIGPHAGSLGPSKKRCSISTVTYNSSATIDACVESVLASLSPDDEWFIVDNASSDDTLTKLRGWEGRDGRIKVIENSLNLGFSVATNLGLLQSTGRYLVMLNPDTIVWPGWLERMIAASEIPGAGAVGPISDNTAGEQFCGFYLSPNFRPSSHEELAREIFSATARPPISTKLLMGFCLLIRRDIADIVGLLDEEMFLGGDDLDLSWRLQEIGYALLIARNVFVHHAAGASFATMPARERPTATFRADAVLRRKLASYYPCKPISKSIWGISIADELLNR